MHETLKPEATSDIIIRVVALSFMKIFGLSSGYILKN